MNKKRIVKKILVNQQKNKKFNIYNKNLNLNLIHTKDVSNLITKTFEHAEGIYNLTSNDNITIEKFNNTLLGKKTKKGNKINNYSSRKFFNKFPDLKIIKLKTRIEQFKDEN